MHLFPIEGGGRGWGDLPSKRISSWMWEWGGVLESRARFYFEGRKATHDTRNVVRNSPSVLQSGRAAPSSFILKRAIWIRRFTILPHKAFWTVAYKWQSLKFVPGVRFRSLQCMYVTITNSCPLPGIGIRIWYRNVMGTTNTNPRFFSAKPCT